MREPIPAPTAVAPPSLAIAPALLIFCNLFFLSFAPTEREQSWVVVSFHDQEYFSMSSLLKGTRQVFHETDLIV
jgi:hypothetical protein